MQVLSELVDGNIFCIHANRTDRRELIQTWSRLHNVRVNIFPAIIDTDGRKGCAQSHIALAKLLLQKNSPYVLVLEDDAIPTDQILNVQLLSDTAACLRSSKYDVVWLGGLPSWNSYITEWKSVREGPSWTTHAMILSRKALQWLAAFEYGGKPIDVELALAPLRMAWVWPSLMEQADTVSNIRRSALSQTGAFGSFLLWWTPTWRSLVFHKQICLILVLTLLMTVFILK